MTAVEQVWSPPGGIRPGTIIMTTTAHDRSGFTGPIADLLDELGIGVDELATMVADDIEDAPPELVKQLRGQGVSL